MTETAKGSLFILVNEQTVPQYEHVIISHVIDTYQTLHSPKCLRPIMIGGFVLNT